MPFSQSSEPDGDVARCVGDGGQLPSPRSAVTSVDIERRATEIGRELLRSAREQRSGVLSSRFWVDQMMSWAMHDPAFKVQLFRFVDVFPMLRTAEQVYDYLSDYLNQPGVTLPPSMKAGMAVGGFARKLAAKALDAQIGATARTFIAGVDATSALPTLRRLWTHGVAFSIDLLGEACVSNDEARQYQDRYLGAIESLAEAVRHWPPNALLENDHLGPVPRANVSIKLSSLTARADAVDFEGSLGVLADALRPILEAAARRQVLVNFDMEQYAIKDLTLALFRRCCEAHEFPAGLALQAYLRSGRDDAEQMIAWRGVPVGR